MPSWIRCLLQTKDSLALLPIRLAWGVIFMGHGAQKLWGIWGGYGLVGTAHYMEKLGLTPGALWAWLAALGEFGGGALVLLGLWTRFGALNLIVCMSVAMGLAQEHRFFLPEGMEYCFALAMGATALLIGGGGRFSLDRWLVSRGEKNL